MRHMLLALACLGAAQTLGCASHSQAASLRQATMLDRPDVRIADLFDDAGPDGARVLGPGPAPGGRIVVGAAQLAAIARQFGVAWRPNATTDRVVIERPGTFVPREQVIASLRQALQTAGARADRSIDVPGLVTPLVAPEAVPVTTVEQLDFDPLSGRFSAMLTFTVSGEPLQRLRVAGTAAEMADAVVTTHRLPAGSVIGPADLAIQRGLAEAAHDDVVRDPAQALGLALQHPMAAGQRLRLAELGPPMAVLKGARVSMELQAPGLSVTGSGVAMESGPVGARISVRNLTSRAVVDAEILGPDRVRVTPDRPRLVAAASVAGLEAQR